MLLAFAQYVLDSRYLHRQKQLRMSRLGRWNGILYFVLPLLLAVAMLMPSNVATIFNAVAYAFAWALIVSTLASIVDRAIARS